MDEFVIEPTMPNGIGSSKTTQTFFLNNISPEERDRHDTLDEELNCFIDYCPWVPTGVNLDEVKISPTNKLANKLKLEYCGIAGLTFPW